MSKYTFLFGAALIFLISLLIFSTKYSNSNRQTLTAAVLASIGIQNPIVSQSDMSTTTPTLLDVLQQLQDQEEVLSGEVTDLRTQAEVASLKSIFTRTLKRGDSGDDVKALQGFLTILSDNAATSTKGFFGTLTEKGVQDFQIQAGLKGTGVFDKLTRDKLAEAIQNKIASDTPLTDFIPIDLSLVAGPQQDVQNLKDQIPELAAQLSDNQATLIDLQNQITDLESEISDLQANSSSQSLPQTPPAAPVAQPLSISNIQVSDISKMSVTITWSTTNPSTSEVDYSKNSSMLADQTNASTSPSLVSSHSLTLSSLSSGTTYYYQVVSKDATGAIAKSNNLAFTTGH